MLGRVVNLVRGDRFDPTTSVFPNINAEKLSKDLRLERKGEERGGKSLPNEADQGFDSVEHEIVSAVDALRTKGLENFHQHQKVYAERLGRAAESRVAVATIAGDAEADMQGAVKVCNALMANKRGNVSRAADALQHFYEANPVRGAPREGSGLNKFLGVAAVILVIESMANGALFREASTQGLLGGFIVAVTISVLNIGFASLTGHIATNLNHVRWLRKLLSLVFVLAGIGLVIVINMAAAHFRDAATAVPDMEAAAVAALDRLVAAPHGLSSLQSWLLAGLGMLFAIVAGWKAYHVDDPYPGFGRVWRQMARARDEYALALDQAISELDMARTKAVEDLNEESETARGRINEALSALSGQSSLRGNLQPFLEQCDQKANRLLAIYRDANRASRQTPPPRHFSETFAFKPFEPEVVDPRIIDAAQAEQEEIKSIVSQAVDRIYAAAKSAIASYPDTDALEELTLSGAARDAVRSAPPPAIGKVHELAGHRRAAS